MCLVNDDLIDWVKRLLGKYSFELVHVEERERKSEEGRAPEKYIYLTIRCCRGAAWRFVTTAGTSRQHQRMQIEQFVKDAFYEYSINAYKRENTEGNK